MNILITGGTGFIGKALTKKLLEENHKIFVLVREDTNKDFLTKYNIPYFVFSDTKIFEFEKFLKEEKIDGTIHLASLFLKKHTTEDVKPLIESNITFGSIILDVLSRSNTKWFLNTGTFWQHYKNKEYSPVNLYASSKEAFEKIMQYYSETTNLNIATIALNDTFGPDDTRPKIFNLWKKIAENNETLEMSKGQQMMDIVYIDDVVSAYSKMIHLLEKDSKRTLKGRTFAVYAKKRISLFNLAKLFEKISGYKLQIKWGAKPYMNREVMIPWNKGRPIPKWKAGISLEDGIRKFINTDE